VQPAETTQAATPNLTDIPFEQQSDALKAAFEARAKADMAILEALATQKNAQDEAEATKAAAEKGATTQPSNFTPDAIKAKAQGFLDQLIVWSKSPSFLAQIVAIIFAYFLSAIAAGMLKKRIPLWSREPDATAKLLPVRKIVYRAGEFLRPIVVVTLLAFFAIILKALPNFGQDWLVKIAQGLSVVFLLFSAIKTFVPHPVFRKLATWTLVPLALLAVVGYFDNFIGFLEGTTLMSMGETPITAMTVIRLALFGAFFFWTGSCGKNIPNPALCYTLYLDPEFRRYPAFRSCRCCLGCGSGYRLWPAAFGSKLHFWPDYSV